MLRETSQDLKPARWLESILQDIRFYIANHESHHGGLLGPERRRSLDSENTEAAAGRVTAPMHAARVDPLIALRYE